MRRGKFVMAWESGVRGLTFGIPGPAMASGSEAMSLSEPVGVALVGVGGHAVTHRNALWSLQQRGLLRLLAVCEAAPDRWATELDELRQAGVAVEPDLVSMLKRWRGKVSLVGVPVGIPGHRPVTVQVLQAGCNVVLEKPVVGCIDDFDPILQAERQAGRACAVHFQAIWNKTLRAVKGALVAGKIGTLREIRIKGRWFREDRYYTRNAWAGQLRVGNTWVLDGTINNPFAHQVNNALFLAGCGEHSWANPLEVRAELYHARPGITGDDTTCLAVRTDTGVDLTFAFTLCSRQPERSPVILVFGDNGQILWPLPDGSGEIRYADGRVERIEPDNTPGSEAVYTNICNYLLGREDRVLCRLADTLPFTQTISAAYEAAGPPAAIGSEFVQRGGPPGKEGFVLQGVDETIDACFETGQLFSDLGTPWAVGARCTEVGPGYRRFQPKWDVPRTTDNEPRTGVATATFSQTPSTASSQPAATPCRTRRTRRGRCP